MIYKIIVSLRAQKEIENAIDYYAMYSKDAPLNFVLSLKDCYTLLETSPFFRVRYKNIRAVKLERFPYSLFYIVNENNKQIRVLSCFHNKRNPNKNPKF
jgi:toxin ParE1/3/4